MFIKLIGEASKTTKRIEFFEKDLDKTLLDFLREHSIPIASSCSGRAQCRKCIFNGDQLSCDKKMSQLNQSEIRISYL